MNAQQQHQHQQRQQAADAPSESGEPAGIESEHTERGRIVGDVLESWAIGIRAHRPDDVAATFTVDALFQGFDPHQVIGRPGIAAYYDKQPIGLGVEYEVVEHRTLADGVVIAYVDVEFIRPEGVRIPVHLTVVLLRLDEGWLLSHYHVSKIG